MCFNSKHQSSISASTVSCSREKTFILWLIVMVYQKFNISMTTDQDQTRHDNECAMWFSMRHVANVNAKMSHVSMWKKNETQIFHFDHNPQNSKNHRHHTALHTACSLFFVNKLFYSVYSLLLFRFNDIIHNA